MYYTVSTWEVLQSIQTVDDFCFCITINLSICMHVYAPVWVLVMSQ